MSRPAWVRVNSRPAHTGYQDCLKIIIRRKQTKTKQSDVSVQWQNIHQVTWSIRFKPQWVFFFKTFILEDAVSGSQSTYPQP